MRSNTDDDNPELTPDQLSHTHTTVVCCCHRNKMLSLFNNNGDLYNVSVNERQARARKDGVTIKDK